MPPLPSPSPAGRTNAELLEFLAPAEKADELGRLGPYRVLKILGAGGMGVVFRAEDPHLERIVALKAMLPSLASTPTAKQRFFREGKAAAALKHPNIVTIFQVGEDRGAPFLAMEFLEGQPLDDYLKRQGKLPVDEVIRIGREIAAGLAAAHEKGLVHRDIKPANIWLEGDNRHVKILDFGLARTLADQTHLTQAGVIVGTPAYMAPEQAEGLPVDHRCDLFSLGCVLYRLSTGEMPFKGDTTMAILLALVQTTPATPMSLNRDIPAELSDLVMRLLARKPEDRPASAREVVETLRTIGEAPRGDRTVVRSVRTAKTRIAVRSAPTAKTRPPASNATQVRPRTKKNRAWMLAAGAASCVLVLAGILLFWQTPQGMVRIDSDDPNVEIVFDKAGPTIKGADKQPITLRAGEHGLLVKRGDFSFETDKLLIKKGQTVTLKIELLADEIRILQDGKAIASRDLPLAKSFTNSLGMEFVRVPRGKSWLGGGDGKPGTKEVEIIHDFFLGKYEVTQEVWQKVMGSNPSFYKVVAGVSREDQKRFPVEQVSWEDCQLFIKRINEQTKEAGWVYRLPTELEWEYACRGGPMKDKSESAFNFYFDKPTNTLLPEQANFLHPKALKRTCAVGAYKPNRLGLYDMHGNVIEWCNDTEKAADGELVHILRGGCCEHGPENCRAAFRYPRLSSFQYPCLGLRLARVPVGNEIEKVPGSPDVPPADHFTDRQVAEWALSLGGADGPWMKLSVKDKEFTVSRLSQLPKEDFKIFVLSLTGSNIADTDLRHLRGLNSLVTLGLNWLPRITDTGLEQIKEFRSLMWLHLAGASITGSGLHHLQGLEKLVYLDLMRTRVGDDSLKALASLTSLTELNLAETPVSDAGLEHLAGLQRLEKLNLSQTRVSAAGVKKLRAALKRCAITWDGNNADRPSTSTNKGYVRSFLGHTDQVWCVAFTPDGKQLLSGSKDNSMRLWDVETGKELKQYLGHTKTVKSLAISADGKRIASGSWDRTVRLWDLETKEELKVFRGHSAEIIWVLFHPDQKHILSSSLDQTVRVWSIATGEPVKVLKDNSDIHPIAITPDGNFLVTGGGTNPLVKIWSMETLKVVQTFPGHTKLINNVAITRDGRFVLSAAVDNTLRIWNRADGKELHRLEGHCASLSPDDKFVMTDNIPPDNAILVYEVDSGKRLARFTGHQDAIPGLVVSPDGKYGASAGFDKTVRLWRLPQATEPAQGKLPAKFTNSLGMEFALVPKGKSWISGGGKLGTKEGEIISISRLEGWD